MKQKTKSPKKAAPKKGPKKSSKSAAKKPQKEVKILFEIRQLASAPTQPGCKHLVRVVNDCIATTLSFKTIEELNEYLFNFDVEHYGQRPIRTGAWIDQIITHVEGEVFDLDQLEQE